MWLFRQFAHASIRRSVIFICFVSYYFTYVMDIIFCSWRTAYWIEQWQCREQPKKSKQKQTNKQNNNNNRKQLTRKPQQNQPTNKQNPTPTLHRMREILSILISYTIRCMVRFLRMKYFIQMMHHHPRNLGFQISVKSQIIYVHEEILYIAIA